MNSELMVVLEYLEHERGIDRETLIQLVEESLTAAARKSATSDHGVTVRIDRMTGDIRTWAHLKVVEAVSDPETEVALEEVRQRQPEAKLGDEVEWEVVLEDLGRIAAQTAKQAITFRLRQAEKKGICEDFQEQLHQLVTGVVRRVERGDVFIDFSRAEGVMKYAERIPGEDYQTGDHITALLVEINAERPGPSLFVSRAHPDMVCRLFEREVTEIAESLVKIRAVAREAGYRTKIAVTSSDPRIDPVGACVGLRGNRVKTVVRELGGEKVDIIRWDEDVRVFVANALQPAKLSTVTVDEAGKCVHVVVPEDQLSLAIGRKGQNARLAHKLTGWRIDINRHVEEARVQFEDKIQHAIEALARIDGIGTDAAPILVRNGFLSLEGILAAEVGDIAALETIGPDRAAEILAAARRELGA
ncbi:MAG: transcription termination/antitermination protein NusA [Lentisphaerae bacterium]|nr:transcription termination/antitermination protein NusA [Lentisphaerota bacterium]